MVRRKKEFLDLSIYVIIFVRIYLSLAGQLENYVNLGRVPYAQVA